jgi:hypothetical protein
MERNLASLSCARAVFHSAFSAYAAGPTFRVLEHFNSANGSYPNSVIADASGNVYGTTFRGSQMATERSSNCRRTPAARGRKSFSIALPAAPLDSKFRVGSPSTLRTQPPCRHLWQPFALSLTPNGNALFGAILGLAGLD